MELEWDRRFISVLGVANKRLYQLRLQTADQSYQRNKVDFSSLSCFFLAPHFIGSPERVRCLRRGPSQSLCQHKVGLSVGMFISLVWLHRGCRTVQHACCYTLAALKCRAHPASAVAKCVATVQQNSNVSCNKDFPVMPVSEQAFSMHSSSQSVVSLQSWPLNAQCRTDRWVWAQPRCLK